VRASRSRLLRAEGLTLEVALAAAPVDGAANAALLELLAELLAIRASALRLVVGKSSKQKVVEVAGMSAADAAARLSRAEPRK
jgi:uncharacterized protein YggU (UPF0235/DUF167 family)